MKRYFYIIMIIIFVLIIEFGILYKFMKPKKDDEDYIADKVTDECVEDYIKNQEIVNRVNSTDEIISPNCVIIFKKYFTNCNHTINENKKISAGLVNMTEKELKEEYPDWEIIGFASNEITLYKEIKDICDEHYILKETNGRISIFIQTKNGEELYEETDISTEYLTENDLIEIRNGIEIYGKENLNEMLENFE